MKVFKYATLLAVFGYALLFSYNTGRERGVLATKQADEAQISSLRETLNNSPYVRVSILNGRYRQVLLKYGIDPEKEGVYK